MAQGEGTGDGKVVEIRPGVRRQRGGGAPPPTFGLGERIAGLEGAVEGLRHSQNLTIGATAMVGGILAAIIIGFGVYGLQRIDQTQETISREAAATRQDLVGVTTAIANSITASREMRPQIVVVPAPGAPQEPRPPAPNPRK